MNPAIPGRPENRFWVKNLLPVGLILACGLAVYLNSFSVPFIFDDRTSIEENPVITSLGNFFLNGSGYHYNPRRFIGYLSFALNYHFGGLDVFGYHLANVLIHLANALLVYALILLIFSTPFLRGTAVERVARPAALLAALLFAVHPVQTQAVTYIAQRFASLTTTFYLLTFVLYGRARLAGTGEKILAPRGVPWYLLSLATALLAMKTKEIAFTLPVLLAVFEFFFFAGPVRLRLAVLAPHLLTLLVIPISLLNLGQPVGKVIGDVTEVTAVKPLVSRYQYLVTQFCVITTYIRLLFWPTGQNLDYDYPVYDSLFAPRPLACFLFLAGLFALAVFLAARARHNRQPGWRVVGFGILWFFVTLSVESSLIPITDVIYEHRVYLPSFGAFMAGTVSFCQIFAGRPLVTRSTVALSAGLVLILGTATWRRNEVWQSKVSLWRDAAEKSPGKVRPFNNLGAALNDAGRPQEAIPVLLQAIEVKPDHADAYFNLGKSFLQLGQYAEAEKMFIKATRIWPRYDEAYVNLAVAYNRLHKFEDSIRLLEWGIPNFSRALPEAHFNLGVAYAYTGNQAGLRRELAAVKRLDPKLAPSLESLLR